MRLAILGLLVLTLPARAQSIEEPAVEPAREPRVTVGAYTSAAAGFVFDSGDEHTLRTNGARIAVRPDGNHWIGFAYGRGSIIYDDGWNQDGSSVSEYQLSYQYAHCFRADRLFCLLPGGGVGYQAGEMMFIGEFDDPDFTDKVYRSYAEGSITPRILLGGHVALHASFAVRYMGSDGGSDPAEPAIALSAGAAFAF